MKQHRELTRRSFIGIGLAGTAALRSLTAGPNTTTLEMAKAIESLEPYFTPQSQFRDVSRGKPLPHSLSDDQKRAVGLTRETWQLEVVSDPDHPATLRCPLNKKEATALDFAGLMRLAGKHAVRYAKTMTCSTMMSMAGSRHSPPVSISLPGR